MMRGGAETGWKAALEGSDGSGVRVALLDSGVERSHPLLAGAMFDGDFHLAESGRLEEGDGTDCFGHGTAVASVIHQAAPGVTIGSFRVLGGNAYGRDDMVRQAALEAVSRGYDIIHCSCGAVGSTFTVMGFKDWLDAAWVAGVHVVAACNNGGAGVRVWPAHFSSVVAVDAVQGEDSNGGFFRRKGAMVEFVVPCGRGRDLAWRGGGVRRIAGTSFCAPVVTGWMARILSNEPGLHPDEMKVALRRLASPLPEPV
jgi:hypothetical protein